MTINHPINGYMNDETISSLVKGWAKSRAGEDVSIVFGSGFAHCIFKYPIGKSSRTRESFYWNCKDIIQDAKDFHGKNNHFLSVFSINEMVEKELLTAGYTFLVNETHMYRDVSRVNIQTDEIVRRVMNAEQAKWYNNQKKTNLIKNPESLDDNIYDFYIRDNNIMTAYARAIHSGQYFIIDDVHTHPEHRRKGLASYLLSAINRQALLANAKALTLISSDEGISLYLKSNFLKGQPLKVYSCQNNS